MVLLLFIYAASVAFSLIPWTNAVWSSLAAEKSKDISEISGVRCAFHILAERSAALAGLEQCHSCSVGIPAPFCPGPGPQGGCCILKVGEIYLWRKLHWRSSFTPNSLQSTVGENQWLQGHLIQLLISYCDLNTAARWAQRCNLPKEILPNGVADELQKLKIQER